LTEDRLVDLLAMLRDDHSYLGWQLRELDKFCRYFSLTGHQFVDKRTGASLRPFVQALAELNRFLKFNFWLFPESQTLDSNARYCLYPDLNIDHAFPVNSEDRAQYRKYARQLELLVERVLSSYRSYRRMVKAKLLV
jgi:excinuclease UvrABC nuclease subunit